MILLTYEDDYASLNFLSEHEVTKVLVACTEKTTSILCLLVRSSKIVQILHFASS